MNVSSEHSKSLWMDTSVYDDAPTLQSDETADVIVVGSGIAGLSIAYELAKAGKSVIVVDRGPIGKGMASCFCVRQRVLIWDVMFTGTASKIAGIVRAMVLNFRRMAPR